jgi:hypothetical protein
MFAYCRNNPVIRKDVSGMVDYDCFGDDFDDEDLLGTGSGGGLWSSFVGALDSASYGLSMAMGSAPRSPEMVSKRYIDTNNIDAHRFKQKAGNVSQKQQSRYDIYKDKADRNRLWVGSKNPKNRDWRPTKYFFDDLYKCWRKQDDA